MSTSSLSNSANALHGEIRTRADVDPLKAPVVLVQHERIAPVQRHETFVERRGSGTSDPR